jgi:hypothetical protein
MRSQLWPLQETMYTVETCSRLELNTWWYELNILIVFDDFFLYIFDYIHALYGDDIFVNCNWVATRWQQYSTHIHTNNTQNDTKQTIHRTTQKFGRVRAVPRLCGLYPGICLTTEGKKHDLNERTRLSRCIFDILLPLTGDILWPILTDRQKCNCRVQITESRVSRREDTELGSYTFLYVTLGSGIFKKWL